ncbi:MAG: hypothetical protein HGA31_02175 [Candidatus Moranbacteria bacterium]|nr:hypothetical protein [Candidatus Moranbacteria bacterium]
MGCGNIYPDEKKWGNQHSYVTRRSDSESHPVSLIVACVCSVITQNIILTMRYYRNYQLYANNPISGAYLRWAYRKGIEDLATIGFRPDFSKKNFSCLLCGDGNERTADEFIKFVTSRNPDAIIWIIDIAEEHLKEVVKLVTKKYKDSDIRIIRTNALDLLGIIPRSNIDWIETDAFFEFFDEGSLEKLLQVWYELLMPEGFITTRDYENEGTVSALAVYFLRKIVMEWWLGVKIYRHTRNDFDTAFESSRLRVVERTTVFPTYKRFSFVKDI